MPTPLPPTDEELESVRDGLRRHAEMFTRIATMAADNGDLQNGLRALAQALERFTDRMTLESLDSANYEDRRDTVAVGLLTMTLAAGTHNYGSVARTIQMIMSDTNTTGD